MSDHSLFILFADQDTLVGADNWWLRLEQEGIEDDTATVAEVAAVVDALFDIEPCNPDQDNTGGESSEVNNEGVITPPVSEEEFNHTIADLFPAVSCLLNAAGQYEVVIRVYRSHQSEPYKLVITNGKAVQTLRIEEQVEINITVKDAASVDLTLPVVSGFDATWRGLVFDSNASCPAPEITLVGSTLNFGKKITGRVQATFLTEYDLVTLRIDGDEGGNPQEGNVLAFYHAMVFELTGEKPLIDDEFQIPCGDDNWEILCDEDHICYRIEYHYSRCSCTGKRVKEYTTEPVESPCPSSWCYGWAGMRDVFREEIFDGYIECADSAEGGYGTDSVKYWVHDPAYYEQKCCYPPEFSLPKCKEHTTKHPGGAGFDTEFYKGIYGDNTRFVAVSPSDGDCGTITIEQVVQQVNCCDKASPIVWDDENSVEVIADGFSGIVAVSGGISPYTWTVRGNGFYLDAGCIEREITTVYPWAYIYTSNSCGPCDVTVTDGCSAAIGAVRSDIGEWVQVHYAIGGAHMSSIGCPGTFKTYAPNSTEQTATKGKYKISQYYGFDQCYTGGATQSWNDAMINCAAAFCTSDVNQILYPEMYTGNCFYDDIACDNCGDCITPDSGSVHYYSVDIGRHSCHYLIGGWWYTSMETTRITSTKIWEWIC